MLLVIGGIGQGQEKTACELTGVSVRDMLRCEDCEWEEPMKARVILDYHLLIKRMLKEKKDAYEYTEGLMAENPGVCVVMDEIGCGVVPVEAFDREYREIVGRIGCILADRAESVYRVFCGIPTRLK